jgi:hypothetical protein
MTLPRYAFDEDGHTVVLPEEKKERQPVSSLKRALYSLWCGFFAAEVVTATKIIFSAFLITPELIRTMNRSPAWQKTVGDIILMLHPSTFDVVFIFGMVTITALFFSKIMEDRMKHMTTYEVIEVKKE